MICLLLLLLIGGSSGRLEVSLGDDAWRAASIHDSHDDLSGWPTSQWLSDATLQSRVVPNGDPVADTAILENVAVGRGSLHLFHLSDVDRAHVRARLAVYGSSCVRFSVLLHGNDANVNVTERHCGGLSSRLAFVMDEWDVSANAASAAVLTGVAMFYAQRNVRESMSERHVHRFCRSTERSASLLTRALVSELVGPFASVSFQELLESYQLTCFRRLHWGMGPRLLTNIGHDSIVAAVQQFR